MHANVELKARDRDPGRTLERALAAGAVDVGLFEQRDTYLAVARGRLKLREERGRPATLVAYVRADACAARPSEYELVPVDDPQALLRALEPVLGVRGIVEKTRRLLLWEQTVRLHLDDVHGLGRFVEIEAVVAAGSTRACEHDQVARLAAAIGIAGADLVAASYVDLCGG